LAEALHISDDHTDDHVPYSTATLNLYLEDVAWAHKQEEILRLFAADDDEKRYRFPPMKPRQRSFIHSIAEDFGFDSESIDPESHRHVMLFKTPKFVAAPMKTLAQAARIKRAQLNISAPVQSVPGRKEEANIDFNGFLLTKPRFALTEDELRAVVEEALPTAHFGISFLSGDQGVGLIPEQSENTATLLTTLQPTLSAQITKLELAAAVMLCAFDLNGFEPRIIQTQNRPTTVAAGGWSQVAAKRAVPRQAPQVAPVGQRPIYTVLGSKLAEVRKKKLEDEEMLRRLAKARAKEVVVDDWEAEAEKEDGKVEGGIKVDGADEDGKEVAGVGEAAA
jgi:transcriptional repressor NF-X1